MASSARGKMKQIMPGDWLPAQTRWGYLARSELPVTHTIKSQLKALGLYNIVRVFWLSSEKYFHKEALF